MDNNQPSNEKPANVKPSDIPPVSNTKFETYIKIVEFGAIFIAVVYFFGFIIVNTYLLKYGIKTFSLIKYEYVAAGVAFLLCVAIVAIPSFLIIKWFSDNFSKLTVSSLKKQDVVWFLGRVIIILSLSALPFILVFHMFFPAENHDWKEYYYWYIGILVCILVIFTIVWIRFTKPDLSDKSINKFRISAVLFCFVALCVAVYIFCVFISFDPRSFISFSLAIFTATYVSHITIKIRNSTITQERMKTWFVAFGGYYVPALVLIAAVGFGRGVYDKMSYVGGSRMKNAVIYMKNKDDVLKGRIIERTDATLFIKDPCDSNGVVEIFLEDVEKILYGIDNNSINRSEVKAMQQAVDINSCEGNSAVEIFLKAKDNNSINLSDIKAVQRGTKEANDFNE
ncbi:MAG: hypothetical protein ABSE89_01230 [Sedimentisphaerales bacterium]